MAPWWSTPGTPRGDRDLAMKAILHDHYGPPEDLTLVDIDTPVPCDDEVLVRVHAASINSWDWENVTGKPAYVRPVWGLFKPRLPVLGADVAGRVAAIGKAVKELRPGDEVLGDLSEHRWGGFAEYTCAPERAFTRKPASMTFAEAAALPQAGCMALQALRDRGRIRAGQRVLINGAGGGVGTFAIQIARAAGAHVTAVDSAIKLERLRSLGAHRVLDYEREDLTADGEIYDLVLDVTTRRSLFAFERVLVSGGAYVAVGGTVEGILQLLLLAPLLSLTRSKRIGLMVAKANHDLAALVELCATGEVKPVIDGVYPLDETPKALRRLGEAQHIGKIVISPIRDGDPPDAKR